VPGVASSPATVDGRWITRRRSCTFVDDDR
jgi:hypothetical protein